MASRRGAAAGGWAPRRPSTASTSSPQGSGKSGRVDDVAEEPPLPAPRALDADARGDVDAAPGCAVVDDVEVGRSQRRAVENAVDAQGARHQPGSAAPPHARPGPDDAPTPGRRHTPTTRH